MLNTKRSFSMLETSPPTCSPFSLYTSSPPKKKRMTTHPTFTRGASGPRSDSKFKQIPVFEGVLLKQYINKTIQKNHNRKNKEQLVFSMEDLTEVITKALVEKEEEIREEFDKTLTTVQQDTFQAFAKFNNDFIIKKRSNPEAKYVPFNK